MRLIAAVIAALLLASPAVAQDDAAQATATLVADRVYLTGDDTLTAEGAVEVLYKGARLTAEKIVYDSTGDRILITGPIKLIDGQGAVALADSGEMSRDLTEGVLRSARMMLDQQLQLAAVELRRTGGGRYTAFDKVVASSCQVCPSNPVPLWEIRARRVIHDREKRMLYYQHAQFRVSGVPIFYTPRLRMPDPTLDRAPGFLIPRFRTTSALGFGVKLPYFLPLGDSRDVTFTPYLSLSRTQTLEFRYREAFRTGTVEFNGALSDDDIVPGKTRGYLFAEGSFRLPRDFRLDFTLQGVTDDAYLLDYDISETDRLRSGVSVTRTRRNEHIDARLFRYWSIRSGDDNSVLPTWVGDVTFKRRFAPSQLGGEGQITVQSHSLRRSSEIDTDANGDGITDGRDVARATLRGDWRRNWVLANGMVVSTELQATADVYAISQDASYPGTVTRFTPAGAVELRWPWVRYEDRGASQVLEPVVQLVWSPDTADDVPNEDSQVVAFDEGNLFGFNRFPGADRHELGTRLNVGFGWTRHAPGGWSMGVTAGRIFRAEDLGQFTPGSGLDGTASDWLVSARVDSGQGLTVVNRALFDDRLDFSLDELGIAYARDRYAVAASYLWLVEDPIEGRPSPSSELLMNARWDVSRNWRGRISGRYDFEAASAVRAGLGLTYLSECATIDLSLSRRFTSSTSVNPSTDFNVSVVMNGFGTGNDGRRYRRSCSY
ncbi:LPS-assembly protein LptD [Defluviimonas salinarum]|uniref:LPS-assembly protein LptD n=1 Tax=Defluviimonas salinarum TaxID=2992147 RepID=A0ABT3IXY6_9RHOB|nr:LPS assembly protein LptD [Defluviimonas salinarum]MCW3780055.1 LPS assembly protein LptD [Defluviimonas salinarum]